MLIDLFVLGGVAFYLLLAAGTILFFRASENDDYPGGTIGWTFAFLAIWLLCGNLWELIRGNPWNLLSWPLIWLAIGFLWSFPRWVLFLRRTLREYQRKKDAWLAKHDGGIEGWRSSDEFSCLKYRYGIGVDKNGALLAPTFLHNRWRMVNWVVLWPWSMIWTIGRDVILDVTNWLLGLFGKGYQRISNWIFQGVE